MLFEFFFFFVYLQFTVTRLVPNHNEHKRPKYDNWNGYANYITDLPIKRTHFAGERNINHSGCIKIYQKA